MLSHSLTRLAIAGLGLLATADLAQCFQLQYLSQVRRGGAQTQAQNADQTTVADNGLVAAPDFGPMDDLLNVNALGDASTVQCAIEQESVLGPNLIEAKGTLVGSALVNQPLSASSSARVEFRVRFEVLTTSTWSTVGDIGVTGVARAGVALTSLTTGVEVFSSSVESQGGTMVTSPGGGGVLIPGTYEVVAWARAAVIADITNRTETYFAEFIFNLGIQPEIERYCTALPNNTGLTGVIDWTGSASISASNLVLQAYNMPPAVPVLFFYGPDQAQMPFGDGVLCVAGGIARLGGPVFASSTGSTSKVLDYSVPPAVPGGPFSILPGSVWNFQAWFRDQLFGIGDFNSTDAIQVRFRL